MKNILKRFVESDTNSNKRKPFRQARIRLTVVTTLVAMFILVSFSFVVYIFFQHNVSSDIQVEKDDSSLSVHSEDDEEVETRIKTDTLSNLRMTLLLGNISGFAFVSIASYVLARKAVAPLEKAHERQISFTSDIAHELRTPLSVLQAAHESLAKGSPTIDNYKEVVDDSLDEIEYMKEMVNNLLLLARVDAANQTTKDIDLIDFEQLASAQIKSFLPYASSRDVSLISDCQPLNFVRVDGTDARTIIANLIKNAIDYSNSGDTVKVSVSAIGNEILLIVRDSGIGINEKDLALIKQRFYKVDSSRSNTHSGSGLGLSIVESLVSKYQAKLSIESELNVGTTVTVAFKTAHQ